MHYEYDLIYSSNNPKTQVSLLQSTDEETGI